MFGVQIATFHRSPPVTSARISDLPSCRIDQSLSLSLIPGQGGACHRPDRLQKVHDALWVGRVHVAGGGGGACLRVGRTAQEQMLCCFVVASAVWTQWRLLTSDSV